MSWTDERVETLKRMWAEGQSASAIAKELGGVTRNAVIGKVHRLGLSNRSEEPEAAPAPKAPDPAPAPAAAKPPEPEVERKPAAKKAAPAAKAPEPAPEPPAPAAEAEAEPAIPAFVPVQRRPIVPAGQPLPPQPSANEISPEALAEVREVEKKARKLSLMELTERTCKWPIGDPATDKFWFCGLPSVAGKPYCEAHVGVAFQPMSARRDRRR
ncbi:MAG: GcrA family cell cycle regulator [Paracoccus sp. (in: a-proteobacteria)]|uniref:GcrA family cell cycle regulator n=1 Tax=Paracoccus sp. TaxID=267 RepID=UPI0026DFDA79|nr:GcrA family cell cycle regulator [Paracoccus sp. (in: a-proteobacteria)]MDO5614401.1 GcrA family cell cycle regulator [Paracoccus sp. (in: a-proteobacteria)]